MVTTIRGRPLTRYVSMYGSWSIATARVYLLFLGV
jgi:hypothetical protein